MRSLARAMENNELFRDGHLHRCRFKSFLACFQQEGFLGFYKRGPVGGAFPLTGMLDRCLQRRGCQGRRSRREAGRGVAEGTLIAS